MAREFLNSPGVIAMPEEAKDLVIQLVTAGAVRVQDPAYHPAVEITPERPFTQDELIIVERIGALINQRPVLPEEVTH